jgi:hypothetical protein
MTHDKLTTLTIHTDTLATVTGGAGRTWGDTLSDAWQGTKNFGGGLAAGAIHGVRAKNEDVARWADTSSQATKAGFEIGAAFSPRRSFPR